MQQCPPRTRPPHHRVFGASACAPLPGASSIAPDRPVLLDLLGPKFRLDHDSCIFIPARRRGQDLHSGSDEPEIRSLVPYRDGVMRAASRVTSPSRGARRRRRVLLRPRQPPSNFLGSLPRDVRTCQRRRTTCRATRRRARRRDHLHRGADPRTAPWTASTTTSPSSPVAALTLRLDGTYHDPTRTGLTDNSGADSSPRRLSANAPTASAGNRGAPGRAMVASARSDG